MSRFQFVADNSATFEVKRLCELVEIERSSYYAWRAGASARRARVAADAARRGIHVTYPKVYLDPGEIFQCAGLVAENFFIFPNGRVYQCPLCEDHPIHAFAIENDRLVRREGLTEARFFPLAIPEGCVMNRLLQPDNISYHPDGTPVHRISCCLLKQEMRPQAG